MKGLVVIGLLLLPLSGCLSEKRETGWSESDVAAFFSGGGGAAVRPAPPQSAPGSQAPGTAASKMLQDPDAQKQEWTQDLWAENQETAYNRCQEFADRESANGNPTVQLGKPSQVYQKASKYGGYLFKCRFSTEIVSYTDHQREY